MSKGFVMLGGAALCGLLLLSGCGKPAEEATKKPIGDAPTAKARVIPSVSTAGDAKQELEVANVLVDYMWAYFDKNYDQGNPNAKDDKKDLAGDTWGPKANPAFSSFVLLGGLRTGRLKPEDKRVEDSVAAIIARQQPSGSFDIIPGTGFRAVYTTSFCIELLSWLRDNGADSWKSRVAGPVGLAMDYLKRSQVGGVGGPLEGSKPGTDVNFGGWAYSEEELKDASRSGGKPSANMSTTIFALDASAAFGLKKDDPLWAAATTFLSRNQNSGEVDKGTTIKTADGKTVGEPGPDSPHVGGSRYSPATSMAGEETLADGTVIPRSYGSMTYALLRGYLHSGLPKNDTRVRLSWKWLTANFDVTKVPGYVNDPKTPEADKQGYYYQFMQMSRTLHLFGESKFEDAKGNTRHWRTEMLNQLAQLQKDDGSFVNDHDRWNEGLPVICSGYILNALADIVEPARKAAGK